MEQYKVQFPLKPYQEGIEDALKRILAGPTNTRLMPPGFGAPIADLLFADQSNDEVSLPTPVEKIYLNAVITKNGAVFIDADLVEVQHGTSKT